MTSAYTKLYGYERPHISGYTACTEISTLESVYRNFRIHRAYTADTRCIRIKRFADTKIYGYAWTWSYFTLEFSGWTFFVFISGSVITNCDHHSILFTWQKTKTKRPRQVGCPQSYAINQKIEDPISASHKWAPALFEKSRTWGRPNYGLSPLGNMGRQLCPQGPSSPHPKGFKGTKLLWGEDPEVCRRPQSLLWHWTEIIINLK